MLSKFCKKAFKDFFFFSKGERNGICVLVSLITLMFSVNFCLPIQSPEEIEIAKNFQSDSTKNSANPSQKFSENFYEKNKKENSNCDVEKKEKNYEMNLEDDNSKNYKENSEKGERRYSTKGERNSEKMSDAYYSQRTDERKKEKWKENSSEKYAERNYENRVGKSYKKFNYDTVRIYVNSADTTELKRLRGIGSVLSARIVKYRDKIGGFKSLEQIQKIYGLSEETYQQILPHLILD